MRARRVIIPIFIVLIWVGLGLLFVNECAYGGGMGAAYRSCDCLGIEWELYDRTAADGPRKTLCIGIVRSRECYPYIGGPKVACDRASSNEYAVEPKSVADAGHRLYIRQLIPGEAWLEDGTSRTFESPTFPESIALEGNAISLDVRVGRKGAQSVTRKTPFTIALLGEDTLQVDCPEANIRVELEDHVERAVNDAIRVYEPVTVPKHQWVEIFGNSSHNAPRWQLWWGDRPPREPGKIMSDPTDTP